jgi:rRNA maturation RNase YbeY
MGDQLKKRALLHYSTSPVQFNFIDYKFALRDRTLLRTWLLGTCKREGKKASMLSYNFCSDEFLLEINKKHLNHDYYTDIITFGLSENEKEIEGDIYISVDRVKENAKELGISFKEELHRVLVHGLLHLCGFDDKTKTQSTMMRKKEDECLSLRPKMLKTFHVKHV